MTPEQLETVFDTLDVERKGYLTLDQFLEKFSEFDVSLCFSLTIIVYNQLIFFFTLIHLRIKFIIVDYFFK